MQGVTWGKMATEEESSRFRSLNGKKVKSIIILMGDAGDPIPYITIPQNFLA